MKKKATDEEVKHVKELTALALKDVGYENLDYITSDLLSQEFTLLKPETPVMYHGNQVFATTQGGLPAWGFVSDKTGTIGCSIEITLIVLQQYFNIAVAGSCPINGLTAMYSFTSK